AARPVSRTEHAGGEQRRRCSCLVFVSAPMSRQAWASASVISLTRNCPKGAMQVRSLLLLATQSLVERHAPRRYDSVLFADERGREALSHSEAPVAAREHDLETFHPRAR